jgi:hypothetical protein
MVAPGTYPVTHRGRAMGAGVCGHMAHGAQENNKLIRGTRSGGQSVHLSHLHLTMNMNMNNEQHYSLAALTITNLPLATGCTKTEDEYTSKAAATGRIPNNAGGGFCTAVQRPLVLCLAPGWEWHWLAGVWLWRLAR